MMRKNIDLFCISAEIIGVSMIVAGLGNQLDNNETDTLTPLCYEKCASWCTSPFGANSG